MEDADPVASRDDEPRVAQRRQVSRHAGRIDLKARLDLTRAELATLAEQPKDRDPDRVREPDSDSCAGKVERRSCAFDASLHHNATILPAPPIGSSAAVRGRLCRTPKAVGARRHPRDRPSRPPRRLVMQEAGRPPHVRRASFSATRLWTSFRTRAAGSGASGWNRIVPLLVLNRDNSARWSSIVFVLMG